MKKLSEIIEERRDPMKIGERDFEKALKKNRRRTKKAFKQVFGYAPELGEAAWVEENGQMVPGWYVYGFLFDNRNDDLHVRTVHDTWLVINRPWVFRKWVLNGRVVREPLDGYNGEHDRE